MKTPAPSDPDWPPIIGFSKVRPVIRLRDTLLTVMAWIFLVDLLWELCALLWDYFGHPLFELSSANSVNWLAFADRIGGFALLSLFLVLWLAFWGFVRRKELRRTHDPRPVSPLPVSDHAAIFGIPPVTIERWRQSQAVLVQFDAFNRPADVTPKTPDPASVETENVEKDKLSRGAAPETNSMDSPPGG